MSIGFSDPGGSVGINRVLGPSNLFQDLIVPQADFGAPAGFFKHITSASLSFVDPTPFVQNGIESGSFSGTVDRFAAVPLPGALPLMSTTLLGFFAALRRKRGHQGIRSGVRIAETHVF